jgi:hypothetical protein
VKVFFDNCTAPVLANTLDAFLRGTTVDHSAVHIKDVSGLSKGRHTTDIEWINHLRTSSLIWAVISGDDRIRRNAAERAAFRSAGLHGFVLAAAYQKFGHNQVAATLLWLWPEMLKITEILQPPSMHEIPIGKLRKLKQLSF